MKADNVIEVNDVKKDFKVYSDKGKWLKDRVVTRGRNRYELRHVLKGISFEIKKGEAIGLIGKNGCGKSTTLKLLSRIIRPNSGSIEIEGRVSSLLELGAGFHPDLSGRKNIYMNAAIFGLSKKEIDERLNDIIRFSELEDFIDDPIRTYSSGMYMRLAFSVAINVDADILLIDEILAVGDISFQTKCFEKLKEIKKAGTTIIIVSHSLDQIEKICNRSIWLEDGMITHEGIPKYVHEKYLAKMEEERLKKYELEYMENIIDDSEKKESNSINRENENVTTVVQEEIGTGSEENINNESDNEDKDSTIICNFKKAPNMLKKMQGNMLRMGSGEIRFKRINILNEENEQTIILRTGEKFFLYVEYEKEKDIELATFCLEIYRDDGVYCYGTNTYYETGNFIEVKDKGSIIIEIEKNMLLTGKYVLDISVHDRDAKLIDMLKNIITLQVTNSKGDIGICRLESAWRIK